jgi:hypothetical protein
MTRLHSWCLVLILASSLAHGQHTTGSYVIRPNQEVQVGAVPSLMARSKYPSDVLLTSLDTIFHDRTICCGKDSALENSAQLADPSSLKDIASKLQGRHLLSDGRPIRVAAELLPGSANDVGYRIVSALVEKHALLMLWNSQIFVLRGATFDETIYSDGTRMNAIRKLSLIDPRFSDSRREATFNRETDDWSKVQGMLLLTAAPQ